MTSPGPRASLNPATKSQVKHAVDSVRLLVLGSSAIRICWMLLQLTSTTLCGKNKQCKFARAQDLKCCFTLCYSSDCSLLSKPVRIGIFVVVVIIVIGIVGFRQPPQKIPVQPTKNLQMWCKMNDSPAKAVRVGLQKGRCQFFRFLNMAVSSATFYWTCSYYLLLVLLSDIQLFHISFCQLSKSCCAIGSSSSWWQYGHNMSQYSPHALGISACFKSQPAEHSENLGVPPESLALPFPRRHCSTSDVYSKATCSDRKSIPRLFYSSNKSRCPPWKPLAALGSACNSQIRQELWNFHPAEHRTRGYPSLPPNPVLSSWWRPHSTFCITCDGGTKKGRQLAAFQKIFEPVTSQENKTIHPSIDPFHPSIEWSPGHRPPSGAWGILWKCHRADRGRHPMPGTGI